MIVRRKNDGSERWIRHCVVTFVPENKQLENVSDVIMFIQSFICSLNFIASERRDVSANRPHFVCFRLIIQDTYNKKIYYSYIMLLTI